MSTNTMAYIYSNLKLEEVLNLINLNPKFKVLESKNIHSGPFEMVRVDDNNSLSNETAFSVSYLSTNFVSLSYKGMNIECLLYHEIDKSINIRKNFDCDISLDDYDGIHSRFTFMLPYFNKSRDVAIDLVSIFGGIIRPIDINFDIEEVTNNYKNNLYSMNKDILLFLSYLKRSGSYLVLDKLNNNYNIFTRYGNFKNILPLDLLVDIKTLINLGLFDTFVDVNEFKGFRISNYLKSLI